MDQTSGSPAGQAQRGQQWRGRSRGWGRGRGWWRGRGGKSQGQYFSHHGGRGTNGGRGVGFMNNPMPNTQRPRFVQTHVEVSSPYSGWKLYFPDEVYSDHSATVQKVQVFEKYFISWQKLYNWDDIELRGFFTIDYNELSSDQIIKDGCLNLDNDLRDTPDKVLPCLGLAMHQLVSHHHRMEAAALALELGEGAGNSEEESYIAPFIRARVLNFGTVLPFKSLKANCYGKFVSVRGTVVRVSNIKPMCTTMAFECVGCHTEQTQILPDGKYIVPTKCPGENCRGRTFLPKRTSDLTETIDWQTIRLQEITSDNQKEAGRIPRTVDCELTSDLVDSCVPGDVVTVSGIVKVNSIDEGRSKNKEKCMFLLYIFANSISNSKGCKTNGSDVNSADSREKSRNISSGGGRLAMEFSMKELYAIQEIQSEPNLFRLLVASLCPTIYGHELVKAGLILGLFGSGQKFVNDRNRIPVRGDPHILVVGDPGLGKSQMLQAASTIAPRSVYVCGNTTTTSGLTVTLSKDGKSGGDFALEAGALVLADQGCCCIDEFDKMGSQHQALLEAMEQQSISIAKAGIVCSLPARTSILAAANPVGGHYNKAKTVAENLKMGSALLSRFDLVFIMLDKPDENMDCLLSEHVMALHAGQKGMTASTTVQRNDLAQETSYSQWEADKPLSEKLKVPKGQPLDPIPPPLLRKYIGYARKYVHPKIGKDAAKNLQNFYLELRKRHQTRDSTPITTRQLESLIRLTEARARLELREEATAKDAEEVVEIMKYSMLDVFTDQFGLLDFQRSQLGSGMSGRSIPKKFISALQRVAEQTYNSIFTVQQMWQISKDIGLQVSDFETFVCSLNNQGYLLKKGSKVYQLQTFDY
ncbi:DNA helicase MCM8-like [Pomacea canaliculata]|uniref:DNA helicase MCM8-like n=1 Tax=Pomacea canaliculata TaxID=400727 RepID=UPI000D725DF8|nr:DNA helicase MCM8-like [Pomacea canaliculata]